LPVHPRGIIENTLDPSCFKGFVDPVTIPAHVDEKTEDEERIERARAEMPPIEALINLHDFEVSRAHLRDAQVWQTANNGWTDRG
jgi:L-lactate dehydrogenase (cytochrome)